MTPPEIHDRGRGPEIKGTRITVYDVLDYHKHGWPASQIAEYLNLPVPAIDLAIAYIEAHRDEVWATYRAILARQARGNQPEVRALMAGSRERLEAFRDRLRAQAQEKNGARHPG